jgi:hypothetical protein
MKKLFFLSIIFYAGGISYLYINNIKLSDIKNNFFKEKDIQKNEIKVTKTKKLEKLEKLEKKIDENKTKEISKDAIVIKLPEVPKVDVKVPQVVTLGSKSYKDEEQKTLSMEIPIVKKQQTKNSENNDSKENISTVGLNKLGRLSAYLRGNLTSVNDVKERLKKAKFEIIAVTSLDDSLDVIIFSDEKLKKLAKKSPYMANLRVLINKKDKEISILNPYYFAKAYLKNNINEDIIKDILKRLDSSFENLRDSNDKLKYTLLPNYQFMFGMPNYEDMIIVAKAKNSQSLINNIKNKKESISFIQKIDKNRFLVGANLKSTAHSFYKITGIKNSILLPYPIMIENGIAKILDPKYYIALSYPMLKMSQFMKISSVPDEIKLQIKGLFK